MSRNALHQTQSRCLNPRVRHANPPYRIECQDCKYLIQDALIENRYRVTGYIGQGGYGDVYEIRELSQLGNNRTLALKILRADRAEQAKIDTITQEATQMVQLEHDHILKVLYSGLLDSQRPYFVMERAVGTLRDVFRNADGQPRLALVEELVPYLDQAANALHFIHQNNAMHQDIKPQNFLIGSKGQLFLSDFGTTAYLRIDTNIKTHITVPNYDGITFAYSAPEQIKYHRRREADQYALAASVYELLTGQVPFSPSEYPRLENLFFAIANLPPQLPQARNPKIPLEITPVLMRALAKDYQYRYPGVLDFALAYKEAVQQVQRRCYCDACGFQSPTTAKQCENCKADQHQELCSYCRTSIRFGQRFCTQCGHLTMSSRATVKSSLVDVTIHQRYIVRFLLKDTRDVLVAVASDQQEQGRLVVLKRWRCINVLEEKRQKEFAHYTRETYHLKTLLHPRVPRVLDRFIENSYYYVVFSYIPGDTLEERVQKKYVPLAERDVLNYTYTLLNILQALESNNLPQRYIDITPANIILGPASQPMRASLVGFRTPPLSTTRRLSLSSPYSPDLSAYELLEDNQRISIYTLATSMYYALTATVPTKELLKLPIKGFNSDVSEEFSGILQKALAIKGSGYLGYAEMQRDIRRLLQ